MRRVLATLALLLALPAWGANVTATTGWAQGADQSEPNGTLTIDAGSNRLLIVVMLTESNNDPDPVTFTVGGQAPTESLDFPLTAFSTDHHHKVWIWNEAAIAAMSGSAASYSDATAATPKKWLYGTIENADQTALGAFDDTDSLGSGGANQITLTTTSDSGDLALITAINGGDNAYGWTGANEVMDDNNTVGGMRLGFATIGDGTDSVTVTYAAGDASATALVILDASASPAGFDSNPTVTSQTDTTYTTTYDADANSANYFLGLYPKDATAPTCDEIEAGTGDRSNATEATTGSSDTLNVAAPEDPPWYIGDLYGCVKGAGGGSSVVAMLDEVLDVPTGMQRLTLTSIDATSPYDGTAVETGDTCTIPLVTSPSGYSVTDEADGTVSYAAGGDPSRQILDPVYCYDVDSPANHEFTLVYNNQAPVSDDNWPFPLDSLYAINENPAIAENANGSVTDPEGDDIDWTLESGALPDDWVQDAETGAITDGTPGACGDYTGTLGATDAYGALTEIAFDISIGTTVPDAVTGGVDEATAIAAIEGQNAAEGCTLTATAGTPRYSATVALGDVIETDPAVGSLVEPDAEITYILSLGEQPYPDTWVSYARVWMFKEVRRVYLTTTAFKNTVTDALRAEESWVRWAPGTNPWSGSSNMQINVVDIPGVPPLYDNGALRPE